MKNTKAKYKERLKELSKEEVEEELKDLKIQLVKAKSMTQRFMNPYYGKEQKGKSPLGKVNVKLVKWKIKQIMEVKNEKNNK
jgi:hypothetical protein